VTTDTPIMRRGTTGASVKEMEAAAVAWTCQQLGVPFVALKGITDLVDGEHATRDEFERNLATAAASLQEKLAVVLALLGGEPLRRWAT
jgi:5'-methylthioadenosine nucleosidase